VEKAAADAGLWRNCGDVFDNGPPGPTLIERGYAVWTTDDGHVDSGYAVGGQPVLAGNVWSVDAPGKPNAEAMADYAYRAVHSVAQAARTFTARVYRAPEIDRAYFMGCSDGGREAMQEASLYPDDFDGIVAGAPFMDPAASVLAGISTQLTQLRAPQFSLSAADFAIVSKSILAKCDASDGVIDGLVQNPATCAFDPQVDIPRCDGPAGKSACLTQPQIDSVTAMLSAVRTEGGRIAGPGITTVSSGPVDVGGGLGSWAAFPVQPKRWSGPAPFGPDAEIASMFWAWPISDGFIRNFTFYGDLNYDSLTTLGMRFSEKKDFGPPVSRPVMSDEMADRVRQSMQALGSASPYLLANFIASNKKLIMWHGLSDGLLSPDVGHCGWSGAGPNAFETLYHKMPGEPATPTTMDAEHDLLMALEAWVERKSAPEHIIASRYQDDDATKPITRAMPLCPFPAQARYNGFSDVHAASSWSCPLDDRRMSTVGNFGLRGGL